MRSSEQERDQLRDEFVRLFQRYERSLYGYILSLVPNIAAADEISQNTNLLLWKEFARFDAGKDFGVWARTIAYYQVLSYRNLRDRERLQFDSELVDSLAAQVATQCDELVARQSHLVDCLAKLAESKRQAIRLHHYLGLTVKVVAEKLGQSAAATEKMLLRTRRTLFDCVEAAMRREDRLQ